VFKILVPTSKKNTQSDPKIKKEGRKTGKEKIKIR
jgi:hypothetical protein